MPSSTSIGVVLASVLLVTGCAGLGSSAAPSPAPIKVPALKGKQAPEAEFEALKLGLTLVRSGLYPESFCLAGESCVIYAMNPAAGTPVPWGTQLQVKVLNAAQSAFYAEHRAMPDLVGRAGDSAGALLHPVSGLVQTSLRQSPAVPAGFFEVIAQYPRAGARLRVGQRIKLIIASNGSCKRHWWC